MRKPNFFIIGAPKCGTTSLAAYLAEHPNVFMCYPKEPHFFSTDRTYRPIEDADHYFSLYGPAKPVHLAVGEASTSYLRSPAAIENIKRECPSSKYIVLLRNPIEMAYSLHGEFLASAQENERDFERAWKLQANRRLGKSIPRMCHSPEDLQYKDVCSIGTQLERLLNNLPHASVHVVFFEDIANNPLHVYRETLRFLGVPYDNRTEFPKLNSNKEVRFRVVLNVIEALRLLKVWLVKAFRLPGRLGILTKIDMLNRRETQRPPLRKEFRVELLRAFKAEIEKIGVLTKRDVSSWMNLEETPVRRVRAQNVNVTAPDGRQP